MRLHQADHHVHPAAAQRVRLLEHAVGLADARREAEENPQLGAVLTLRFRGDPLEQGVGIRTAIFGTHPVGV